MALPAQALDLALQERDAPLCRARIHQDVSLNHHGLGNNRRTPVVRMIAGEQRAGEIALLRMQ